MIGAIDLHTHHDRCGHAAGGLEAYVRHAAEQGMAVLGVSDHAPLFASPDDHPLPRIQMAKSQYAGYLAEAKDLRARYAGTIDLRIGIEADYVMGEEGVYRSAFAASDLDYVIGSVHAFGPFHVYQPETWPAAARRGELLAAYFEHVRAAATSGLFDVLGHFDAVKVHAPEVFDVARAELEVTLDAIADSGIVVEFNTAGSRKCGEVFPRPELARRLVDRGVAFTYGSDAHAPAEVGFGFGRVLQLCHAIGVRSLATFRGRAREDVPLPALQSGRGNQRAL